jgi:hypothetical protein
LQAQDAVAGSDANDDMLWIQLEGGNGTEKVGLLPLLRSDKVSLPLKWRPEIAGLSVSKSLA